ncbi:hypothetical protein RHMOL_Rhmol04G0235900 [Rhododendron molle]|uniref:Uncharacterized protein n=1 Tax=Rhododendron molle TaxID=49168 RepID=A0ACC0P5B4_RHOML|nr:hypothetical protein RHMOL_Rhmol04G0235900 [Rhododendron molle]
MLLHLQNGAFVFNASISDLFHQSIPIVQLNSTSSLDSPYFNITDPNPSPSLLDQFRSDTPLLEVDMQAIGWVVADNMDYATPIINEWSGFELDGFPKQPEYLPYDQACSVFNAVCDADHDPCSYIVSEEFSCPDVPYPSNRDYSIMVTDLVPPANLWDVDEIVDIQVGVEVWAVNRSLADGVLWDVPFMANPEPITKVAAVTDMNFWDSLLMKDLAEDLGLDMEVPKATTVSDKGKRKLGEVPSDLWDVNEDPQLVPSLGNVHNVTRSGRIFHPTNLQAGNSPNPSNQRNEPSAFPRSAPLEADVTPEMVVSLILPPTSKHTVVFTDKDLPVEGVDHNCPLHITVKCRGLWVPTVLIDNGSAINICPVRVAYRLGLAKKNVAPSNLAVKAYDGTRRMVEGTLMLRALRWMLSSMSSTFLLPSTYCWTGRGSIDQISWLSHLLFTRKSFWDFLLACLRSVGTQAFVR